MGGRTRFFSPFVVSLVECSHFDCKPGTGTHLNTTSSTLQNHICICNFHPPSSIRLDVDGISCGKSGTNASYEAPTLLSTSSTMGISPFNGGPRVVSSSALSNGSWPAAQGLYPTSTCQARFCTPGADVGGGGQTALGPFSSFTYPSSNADLIANSAGPYLNTMSSGSQTISLDSLSPPSIQSDAMVQGTCHGRSCCTC